MLSAQYLAIHFSCLETSLEPQSNYLTSQINVTKAGHFYNCHSITGIVIYELNLYLENKIIMMQKINCTLLAGWVPESIQSLAETHRWGCQGRYGLHTSRCFLTCSTSIRHPFRFSVILLLQSCFKNSQSCKYDLLTYQCIAFEI